MDYGSENVVFDEFLKNWLRPQPHFSILFYFSEKFIHNHQVEEALRPLFCESNIYFCEARAKVTKKSWNLNLREAFTKPCCHHHHHQTNGRWGEVRLLKIISCTLDGRCAWRVLWWKVLTYFPFVLINFWNCCCACSRGWPGMGWPGWDATHWRRRRGQDQAYMLYRQEKTYFKIVRK